MTSFNENLKYVKEKLEDLMNYNYSQSLIYWDLETGSPKEGVKTASKILGFYGKLRYNILTDKKMNSSINALLENPDKLEEKDKKSITEIKKEIDKIKRIPQEEYQKYSELLANAQAVWGEAKTENDFNKFKPYLQKIVDYNRKYADYKGYQNHPYDALLDDYEPNSSVKQFDAFFDNLKKELVPFIEKVNKNSEKIDDGILKAEYDTNKQKEFSKFIAEYLGFDFNRGILKESLHPFSMGLSKFDVRMTTRYDLNYLPTSLFGTIHETGHSIYEQNIGDNIKDTILGTGNSMGIHESQSRLYENLIARTYEFWIPVYEKLQELFPENLKNTTLDDFYKSINKSESSLIRIEADELTYSLHIMLRYDIEKELIQGSLKVEDLPQRWNELTKQYLGLEVKKDSEGVLQDVHWAAGLIGYFPSYALGSANASQIMNTMENTFDVKSALKKGELHKIKNFLNEKIHKYGKLKDPDELMINATGENSDSKYYVKYLIEKYKKLYQL